MGLFLKAYQYLIVVCLYVYRFFACFLEVICVYKIFVFEKCCVSIIAVLCVYNSIVIL